jgi:hypothetical protein
LHRNSKQFSELPRWVIGKDSCAATL